MEPAEKSAFPLALPPGSRLDHYEVGQTLGCGAFGVTYQAFSHRFQAPCVIKELLPTDYATRERQTHAVVPLSTEAVDILERCRRDFSREASILHQVDHPQVVRILDFFGRNGTSYFVMPYARGMNFEQYLRQREGVAAPAMDEAALLRFIHQVLDGLEAVHRLGYLHRDIKPENIIIMEDGQPLLIDFGAARQLIGSRSRPMSMILSRHYAPFEQYSSTKKQGPYTDIYALGALLHRAMAIFPPEESPDRMDGDDGRVLARLRAIGRYSEHFVRAVDWALQPRVAARPREIAQWREALPALTAPRPKPGSGKREAVVLDTPLPPGRSDPAILETPPLLTRLPPPLPPPVAAPVRVHRVPPAVRTLLVLGGSAIVLTLLFYALINLLSR